MEILLKLLMIAYGGVGIFVAIGYWPTIKDLWINKRKSANIASYVIWVACSVISFLYSLFILKDLLYRIVSGLGLLCCMLILILSIRLKYKKG